jgi:arylsulfatase A-like enzyme
VKQMVRRNALNVVLITIDALRYDHLECYGYHRDTSPNIDALAARGVKFLQAISNGGHTPTAFPSILASALPPLQQLSGRASLQPNVMLAELLKGAGYSTVAFHSNPYLSRLHGYDRGFDTFDDSLSNISLRGLRLRLRGWVSPDTLIGRTRDKVGKMLRPVMQHVGERAIVSAEEITSKAISWLEAHDGKFFLWLHYMDVHQPYLPASKYARYFSDQPVSRREMYALYCKMISEPRQLSVSEVETIMGLYDAEVRYVDEVIGLLLDKLGSHSSNTFMIVTADHGDEFGEHGRFGHHSVYDGILRVPLIITGPGIKGGTLVKQQVGLIDLAPTILDIVGIDCPRSFEGKSLIPRMEEERDKEGTISTIIHPELGRRDIAYRTTSWKYIRTERLDDGLAVAEEVYDLTNDPGETKSLHGADMGEVRKFELEAKDKIAQFKRLKVEESTDYEKQRIRGKLSKLGKL